MKSKTTLKKAILLVLTCVILVAIVAYFYYRANYYSIKLRGTTPIRHDNVNLEKFLILEDLLGDQFTLLMGTGPHRHLGFAMHFLNRAFSYQNTRGLGFREGVVHYEDSHQAYIAFSGYLYDENMIDRKVPSLIQPGYFEDKNVHWYASSIPVPDTEIAANFFFAQYDDVIVYYVITVPTSVLNEEQFIELVMLLDENARLIMEEAVIVDPLQPTFTPFPGMK